MLIPHQISDAAAHDRPRGNLSDLYPAGWARGNCCFMAGILIAPRSRARFKPDTTGTLDSSRPGTQPTNKPSHIPRKSFSIWRLRSVFILESSKGHFSGFGGHNGGQRFSLASPAWLDGRTFSGGRPCGPDPEQPARAAGTQAATIQSVRCRHVRRSVALLAAGCLIPAGILLALATIKPQLVLPLLLWLGLWSLGDRKRRYRLAASFLIVMVVLCAAAEWLLPHWIARFWHAAGAYLRYTHAVPVLEAVVPYPWGRLLVVLFSGTVAVICFEQRREPENTDAFRSSICLVMALTVLTVPTFSLYNQALLLPAILLIARDRRMMGRNLASRALLIAVLVLLASPWFCCNALAALSFVLSQETVERAWAAPLWTVPQIPLGSGCPDAGPSLSESENVCCVGRAERLR